MKRALPWVLLAVAACQTPVSTDDGISGNQKGCGNACGKASVGGRGGGSSTSVGGSSSSSGGSTGAVSTSVGGSSSSGGGGSSGGLPYSLDEVVCELIVQPPTSAVCAAGSSFASQFVDFLSCSVIAGAQVAAVGANGVPFTGAAATSDANGSFAICLPTGSLFSMQITAATYPTTYYAEMMNTDAGGFGQMLTLSSGEIQAFGSIFPGGLDTNKAMIIAKLASTQCFGDQAGWTFGISLPDGGLLPDGGYQLVYTGASYVPAPNAVATSSTGAALFYNIDPTISDFLLVTAAAPDDGGCAPINGGLGFTGRVFVSGGAVSIDPFLLP